MHRLAAGPRPSGLSVSLALHALLLLGMAALWNAKQLLSPVEENIPVELWPLEQWEDLNRPPERPSPEVDSPHSPPDIAIAPGPDLLSSGKGDPGSSPAPPAGKRKAAPDVIRPTRMLSEEVLADRRSRKMRDMLQLMEEETRLEQLCNLEAMAQIAAHLKQFRPDRLVAYAMADPKRNRNSLLAEGAAFRSGKEWFRLKYRCDLKPGGQSVQAFEFSVGTAIPRRDWEAHSLPSPDLDTD